jgi:hypothetical protein
MNDFRKNLTAAEIIEIFRFELKRAQRPAEELILTDVDLCKMLHVSKRTTATWRGIGAINYHKVGGVIFYVYSDILNMMKANRIESTSEHMKIRL